MAKAVKVNASESYAAFKAIMDAAKARFVGRAEAIDLLALALLSKQHIYMLSPPGTAKTAMISYVTKLLGGTFFGVQMRDDTKPEEILGMWDLNALEAGRYKRRWSRAAIADVVYINEAFKGSSNALNAMLGMLHERRVDDDAGYQDVPLWTAILDSNELPRDKMALAAFFDRIIFKDRLDYLTASEDFIALISGRATGENDPEPITLPQLMTLHEYVKSVTLHENYAEDVLSIRAMLISEGISVSDRTWAEACGDFDPYGKKRATPIKASAFYAGRKITKPRDFLTLAKIMWLDPTDQPKIRRAVMRATMPDSLRAEDELAKIVDAYSLAMSGNDRKIIADVATQAADARMTIQGMTSVDEDVRTEIIIKIKNMHATLLGRIMRV